MSAPGGAAMADARSHAMAAMTGRRLLHWADLDERRAGRAGWWAATAGAIAVAVAVLFVSHHHGMVAASRLWLAAAIAATAPAMLGAPFRLYWRHDAALWARLPLPGDALFHVALVRSIRAALRAALVMAPASFLVDPSALEIGARHAALLAVLAAGAALLVPAVALAGGALVATGKAESLMNAMGGGEVAPTPTGWLGALPGTAAAGMVLLALASAPWVRGADETAIGPGELVLGAAAALAIVGVLAARRAAPAVMPGALREVAALDRQQLAHLDLHPPTAIERAWMRVLPEDARAVFRKDARLMRRRYPLAYVIGGVGLLAQWILAAVAPDGMVAWTVGIAAGLAVYAVVLSRRLQVAPIEHPIVLATLPVTKRHVTLAKRGWWVLWLIVYAGLGAAAVVVRAATG